MSDELYKFFSDVLPKYRAWLPRCIGWGLFGLLYGVVLGLTLPRIHLFPPWIEGPETNWFVILLESWIGGVFCAAVGFGSWVQQMKKQSNHVNPPAPTPDAKSESN
jgi:hypothetical protein